MVASTTLPAVLAWTGDESTVERVTAHFYDRVSAHPVLAPGLAALPGDARRHVRQFVAEVFGGNAAHLDDVFDAHLIVRHLGKRLNLQQRRCWMDLLLDSAEAVGVPDNAEFRSSLVAYLEWGLRLAARAPRRELLSEEEHQIDRWTSSGRMRSALQC
jgi:hemoglobin